MTIYSKRRGKRSLAAILAAMLMASVLAVVAGAPAQAANTSFEVKYDHDGNSKTAAEREFAGQDRYDTALRLAKNFARSKGGLGSVPTAVLSSGETLVDSISVAGLAGYLDAPILLTPTGSLRGGVADFIEDYGVSTVYVLGGTAAISDATLEAIEALQSKPTATRIAGADRYDTAAKIAGMIGADSSWCGTTAKSAVLINGATDMMSYGVASQTIAYRLQLPVLMTAADMLPDATADFIDANDIDHVQIIGGADAVSDDVKAELTSLGVDTVSRVDGASAAEVSAELAKLAANGCGDSLGLVSTDRVALVRGNPDGVVAAPVLASSFAGGYLVSPLIVTDSLPASVRDYLAATPKTIGANKLNLGIVAVGGTAAVSQATMDAALEAAASSGALSVTIGAMSKASDPIRPQAFVPTGENATSPVFTLYFSDDILFEDGTAQPNLLAKLRDIIEINGVLASVTNVARSTAGGACDNRRVNVTLGQPLSAGDVISVVASDRKLGNQDDQRTLGAASATVTAPAPDRTRPTASVLGIAMARTGVTNHNAAAFTVTFSDAGGFPAAAADADAADAATDAVSITDFTFVPATGQGTTATNVISGVTHGEVTAGQKSFTVTVQIGRDLEVGDRLVIKPGIVKDMARPANTNAGTSGTAIRAQASPKITSVQMSNLKHTAHNVWTVPPELVAGAIAPSAMQITAKGDGDAAGAAGNEWTMVFDRASNHSADKPLDIDVRVDTRGKRVTVRFNNGPRTANLGDLLKALNGHAGFAERFTASFVDCSTAVPTTALGLVTTVAGRDRVAAETNAGRTRFAIEVRFNAYVATVSHDELLEDLLAAAATRADTTNDDAGIRAIADGTANGATGGLSLASPTAVVGPTKMVRYEGTTSLTRNLPMARDLVKTDAGHQGAATAIGSDNPVITAVTAVATGYAADVNSPIGTATAADDNAADKVDEDKNAASQNRIVVSSSVKAPS